MQYYEGYGYHNGHFEQTYRCYPASFIDKVPSCLDFDLNSFWILNFHFVVEILTEMLFFLSILQPALEAGDKSMPSHFLFYLFVA